ncbi:MAG: serine protein kinase [Proteobacteria bacterium]|nr:serine protein kinase [Pseudomonadota bacterium]NDC24347.1 serine protein kinase [Pseudomonadota bacterium]NDD04334.1 serine protein kinase [Pseudomonadota bacterium]NDG25810.1 serine protein kinase [Pseudomonadota bacterium]
MSSSAMDIKNFIGSLQDLDRYKKIKWEGTFQQYIEMVKERPEITRNAFQRLYDCISHFGTEEYVEFKKKITSYNFFKDPIENGKDAVFGIDVHLQKLVNTLKAASQSYGPEKRVILLHGPVGSAKSTIARMLKKGVEWYAQTDEGAMYTFRFRIENEALSREVLNGQQEFSSPMNEDPLKLIPQEFRKKFAEEINRGRKEGHRVVIDGDLSPPMQFIYDRLMQHYSGDWTKVVDHVIVTRLILSEKNRIGIGTFQPKDEKNQDSTELTGDINYRKIAEYGSDSDPRAFNFDGEFNVANRGILEFIEVLKLDVAFLYDLLGASQEHKIKPKKFPQMDIDEVIIGHTNEPEYRKLQNNEFMEALRDRTVKIDIPYCTKLAEEVRIYRKDFNPRKIKASIAPHTLEMASMWAVLTRLEAPKKHNLSLLQKLKLYNGKTLPGFTEDNVRELRKETVREGMEGISPRYIQDKISNALVNTKDGAVASLNPFMVLNELESGLRHHSLISSEDKRKHYRELLAVVRQEYEDVVKSEVQRAISADEEAMARLCGNYIDNVKAYTQRERVKNKFTGQDEEPDERLMRSVEEKIDIPDSRKDDFRREIMNYIGALALEGRQFDYKTNERLHKALELKLFEDQKDTIKLTSLVSNVVDANTQAKIDIVKARLIKNYGYDEVSATDVLNFVASIFARGDVKRK